MDPLLQEQEAFFAKQQAPVTKVVDARPANHTPLKKHTVKPLLGHVQEREISNKVYVKKPPLSSGFPESFQVVGSSSKGKKNKQSLFAQHMAKGAGRKGGEVSKIGLTKTEDKVVYQQAETSLHGIDASIHEENLGVVAAMSDAERQAAVAQLSATLPAHVLTKFVKQPVKAKSKSKKTKKTKTKKDKSNKTKSKTQNNKSLSFSQDLLEEDRNTANIDLGWIKSEQDLIEATHLLSSQEQAKLKWMHLDEDAESPSTPSDTSSLTATRFDLSGHVADPSSTDPVLFHHQDQKVPGYTLHELSRLARSRVASQRVIALKALAGFLTTRAQCLLEGTPLVTHLPGAMLVLLRCAVDDTNTSVLPWAIHALHAYIVSPLPSPPFRPFVWHAVEKAQGSSFRFVRSRELPREGDEEEDKDTDLAELSPVRFLVRSNFVTRLLFLLQNTEEQAALMELLLHMVRTSKEVARVVLAHGHLIDFLCEMFSTSPEAIQVVYTLMQWDKAFAVRLVLDYDALTRAQQGLVPPTRPKLMQRCLEMWQVVLTYGLEFHRFWGFASMLIQCLGSPQQDVVASAMGVWTAVCRNKAENPVQLMERLVPVLRAVDQAQRKHESTRPHAYAFLTKYMALLDPVKDEIIRKKIAHKEWLHEEAELSGMVQEMSKSVVLAIQAFSLTVVEEETDLRARREFMKARRSLKAYCFAVPEQPMYAPLELVAKTELPWLDHVKAEKARLIVDLYPRDIQGVVAFVQACAIGPVGDEWAAYTGIKAALSEAGLRCFNPLLDTETCVAMSTTLLPVYEALLSSLHLSYLNEYRDPESMVLCSEVKGWTRWNKGSWVLLPLNAGPSDANKLVARSSLLFLLSLRSTLQDMEVLASVAMLVSKASEEVVESVQDLLDEVLSTVNRRMFGEGDAIKVFYGCVGGENEVLVLIDLLTQRMPLFPLPIVGKVLSCFLLGVWPFKSSLWRSLDELRMVRLLPVFDLAHIRPDTLSSVVACLSSGSLQEGDGMYGPCVDAVEAYIQEDEASWDQVQMRERLEEGRR